LSAAARPRDYHPRTVVITSISASSSARAFVSPVHRVEMAAAHNADYV